MSLSIQLKSIWSLLSLRRKKRLILLVFMTLVTSMVEVVSIGAILPFLGVLTNPEVVFKHELAEPVIKLLGISDSYQLILPLTLFFAGAALIAGLMRIGLVWVQTRLAYDIGADIGYKMFKHTLYQPYAMHVARHSSEVVAGITTKTNQVIGGAVLPVLHIITSVLMLSIILSSLILIDPFVAIIIFVGFALLYKVFAWLSKERLVANSQNISQKTNMVVKVLQEALGGVRDIIIDRTQATFCESFRAADISLRRAQGNNQIITQSPRYGIEAIGMVVIAGLAYILGSGDAGFSSVLPVLGAFAIAIQRILPVLQQFYSAWSKLRGSQVIVQDALTLIEQPISDYAEKPDQGPIEFNRSIMFNDVAFRYGLDAPWILKAINLNIPKGAVVGIIGTTGCGKSTLLDLVMGLLEPSEGSIEVDGIVITEGNRYSWQARIAHIPQSIFLTDATVMENIAFGIPVENIDEERVIYAARQAQISGEIESWEKKYRTVVGERGVCISGGQRQRIGIARAFYKQADVIIFDEATSALDIKTEAAVMKAVSDLHTEYTMLIVAHRLSTLEVCDVVVELKDGEIIRVASYNEMVG